MNVPQLRFREFSEEWKITKLTDIAERIMRKNTNYQTSLPLTISSLDGLVDQVTYFNKKIASKDMSGYYLLLNGEFAYNKSYSAGFPFGSIKRLDHYEKGALSSLYICFSLLNNVCSDYIVSYFESPKWHKEVSLTVAEGARNHGLLNVNVKDFFATMHYLPALPEQQKIAEFLSTIDEKISNQQNIVASLEAQKKGFMQKIFSQELRFKGENGGEFPEWKEKKLGDILKIHHGKDYKHLSSNVSKYPVLGSGGVMAYVDDYLCSWECVLIGRKGSIDKPQYMNTPFWCVDTLFYSKPQKDELPIYQFYLFQNINWKKYDESTGVPSLSAKTVENIAVNHPSLPEQQKIANFLSAYDEKIDAEKQILTHWKTIKKAMLQQLFV